MSRAPEDVLKVLEIGRQRIQSSWGRGAFLRDDRYCMMGACGIRAGEHDEFPATQEAIRMLSLYSPTQATPWDPSTWTDPSMGVFNDHPNTTLEMVLECFDRAIQGTKNMIAYRAKG